MIITTAGIKNKETGLIEYFPIQGGGEGSINNFIFSNEQELSTWLEKPSNKDLLTDGSLLFINDDDPTTPNYYWDGEKLVSLNSNYGGFKVATDEEISNMLNQVFD